MNSRIDYYLGYLQVCLCTSMGPRIATPSAGRPTDASCVWRVLATWPEKWTFTTRCAPRRSVSGNHLFFVFVLFMTSLAQSCVYCILRPKHLAEHILYLFNLPPLGSTASHCATYHAWSPDSRHFVTASLAPRMNVDNNLKVGWDFDL